MPTMPQHSALAWCEPVVQCRPVIRPTTTPSRICSQAGREGGQREAAAEEGRLHRGGGGGGGESRALQPRRYSQGDTAGVQLHVR